MRKAAEIEKESVENDFNDRDKRNPEEADVGKLEFNKIAAKKSSNSMYLTPFGFQSISDVLVTFEQLHQHVQASKQKEEASKTNMKKSVSFQGSARSINQKEKEVSSHETRTSSTGSSSREYSSSSSGSGSAPATSQSSR